MKRFLKPYPCGDVVPATVLFRQPRKGMIRLGLLLLLCTQWFGGSGTCLGQWEGREDQLAAIGKVFGDPPEATRLTPKERVWIDRQKHRVIVDGYVAIQDGPLEMFACPVFTKEHESVVALFSKAVTLHAGLLAVGAQTGRPVQWEPEYRAPSGSEIQIQALWIDSKGARHSVDAKTWVRQAGETKKYLEVNWVFAGSGFWEDPDTKAKRYLAESGDLICVSNFSTATLDIPLKSTEANSGLLFMANSETVPPPGTPVRLVLRVVRPQEPQKKGETQETAQTSPEAKLNSPSSKEGASRPTDVSPEKLNEAGESKTTDVQP